VLRISIKEACMANETSVEVWTNEWKAYKKLAEEAFDRYVVKSNDLVRQLALAGIAVVWVFRETGANGGFILAPQMRGAAVLFIVTLAVDIAQNLYGTFSISPILDKLAKDEQQALAEGEAWPRNPKGPPPELSESGVKSLFYLKTLAAAAGAGLLLAYLSFRV
jgi:hypothetical protein